MVTDDGLRIASGDGGWTIQVGTLQQLDLAAHNDDALDLADGTEMRRSRVSVAGMFLKDWQCRVEHEFATGSAALTDAYVTWTAHKPLTVTLGQFKPPFGMEALSQDKGATFMERALPFYLVSLLVVRAPGAMVSTAWSSGSLAGGVFGEPIGNGQSGDEGYGAAARATWAPLSVDLDFDTWYAQLAWTVTGEARPYRVDRGVFESIRPTRNFGSDGWGAFEVAARYSELDPNDGSANGGRERNFTAAVSWYLNPFLRISANYVEVLAVDGGPFDGEKPSLWQMRFQVAL